jgi:hypothetical protein
MARIKKWELAEKYLTVPKAVRHYLEAERLAKAANARGLDHIPEIGNAPLGAFNFLEREYGVRCKKGL